MPWTYEQSTGRMSLDGNLVGTGYAGKGVHKNDPNSERIPSEGPLPRGRYSIGPAYDHHKLGPLTMNLDPTGGQDMYGRSLFRIHGDSSQHPGEASDGCIVISRDVREKINSSNDKTLNVVV